MGLSFFSTNGKKKPAGKPKRSRSLSRSDPPSFGSASSSSSSDPPTSPTTVLRPSSSASLSLKCSADLRRGPDGKVTREELELAIRRLGEAGEEEVAEVLAEADRDGDGRISIEDLLTLPTRKSVEISEEREGEEEELRVAFRVYDVNGDGRISAEELHEVLGMLGDSSCSLDDCRRMIGVVDSDGDGFVGFADFARMMALTSSR